MSSEPEAEPQRLRVVIRGAVQGVGFRPFVYRLATELALRGWVINSSQGVFIEVEGPPSALRQFLLRVESEKPAPAFVQSLESSFLDPVGFDGFEIRRSEESGVKDVLVLPDIATCPECLAEVRDPRNRRYRYPFTNCTNCGPRFTIIEALPYDRPATTMRGFPLCPACEQEYRNPLDRRFHAQPNACPVCGPHLELWEPDGTVVADGDVALRRAAAAIRDGGCVAVKGLGGFHLMVDATSAAAVAELRLRKRREEKPFALMASSLDAVRELCEVSDLERRLLESPEAPIVLLRRRDGACGVSDQVAPRNPTLGVMLPSTPLHHLLIAEIGRTVVATSGNRSDEPICTDERDALERLHGMADLFLVHNRPIARHVDDSIVRVMLDRELVMRRARGYAPLPVRLRSTQPAMLAVGAHLKNTVAVTVGSNAFISQHIGDLETAEAAAAFEQVIESFGTLYDLKLERVACDQHPDYASSRYARSRGLPLLEVQHHFAHVRSCMAENELDGELLGVSWDGTGYGADGTIWGGEFLVPETTGGGTAFRRVAHLRTFRLPGGDAAVREPRRTAFGILYELLGSAIVERDDLAPVAAFSPAERRVIVAMLARGVNAPVTSSAGRLFDAIASIAGLAQRSRFEGQAAMELEHVLHGVDCDDHYPYSVTDVRDAAGPLVVDWQELIAGVVSDAGDGVPAGVISARAHNTLVEAIVDVARLVTLERVVLTGGCFQNRYLTEHTVARLRAEGFRPYWHQRVPPNDGGIALGQIAALAASYSGG